MKKIYLAVFNIFLWQLSFPQGTINTAGNVGFFREIESKKCETNYEKNAMMNDFQKTKNTTKTIQSPWEVQFNYNISTAGSGQYGAETDGNYFYTTKWGNDTICKFDMNGNFIERFAISGISGGIKDLAFDGTYFYGGNGTSNIIYKMNFTTHTLVGTITCPAGTQVRHIAYDNNSNGFWLGGWGSNIILVNYSGTILNTIPITPLGISSISGSAYDNWSTGGPYLWLFDQGGSGCIIKQVNIASKLPTGLIHDAIIDIALNPTGPISGGLFTHQNIISGTVSLGGLIQGTPNQLFGYDLSSTFLMNDVGISELISPHSGLCLTNNEHINIKIENAGMNSQAGFNVTYILNGTDTTTEMINNTIGPFSSINHTFTPSIDLSSIGIYPLKIYTSFFNDENHTNDTLSTTIHLIPPKPSPVVETTFLPVNGTRLKLAIDTLDQLPVPSAGTNQVWDYSDKFIHISDTGFFETNYPNLFPPYNASFPTATNASYQVTGASTFHSADGWGFYIIDTIGLHCIGYRFTNFVVYGVTLDTCQYYSKPMLVVPTQMSFSTDIYDTAVSYVYSTYLGYNVKAVDHAYFHKKSVGYGKLITPLGSFNDVLQVKTTMSFVDSIFVDILGNNSYSYFYQRSLGTGTPFFKFFRNNTFASNELMQLVCGDTNCSYIIDGYYILPVDIGSISGHVYDTLGNPVTSGKMLLYREHSNFRRDDILATTPISPSGYYQFDSIPYGIYRIAARADSSLYPNCLTTFFGNVTDNWVYADTLVTTGDTSGIDIILQHHPSYLGTNNSISGKLIFNLSYQNQNKSQKSLFYNNKHLKTGEPVKDIDISVKKKTNSKDTSYIVAQHQTDSIGHFSFNSLPDDCYTIYVCIPGLEMNSTYDFSVINGSVYNNLDFYVSMDSIYRTHHTDCSYFNTVNSIAQPNNITVYPNPFKNNISINFSLDETSVLRINLFDQLGKNCFTLNEKIFTKGNHNWELDLEKLNLSSGIYLLKYYLNDVDYSIKIMKL